MKKYVRRIWGGALRKGPACLVVPVASTPMPSFGWAWTVTCSKDFENIITNAVTGAEGYSVVAIGCVGTTPARLGKTCITASATVTATAGSSTITVKVASALAVTSTNGAANVTASFVNPPANASVTFLPKVNVSVSKDDGRTSYSPGGTGIYTITVNNTGPGTATGLALGDALPLGVTLNGTWTCTGAGGSSCSAASGTTAAALNALLLTIPAGTAPPGSSTAVVIQVPVTYSNSPANY